jgi:succinate dehydrogenase / fumarate reductase flavoprotein subunit
MLISEACRSQGGYLRNANGERFMEKYHHLKELAPRDVVTRAIYQELLHGEVYLDLTHIPLDIIRKKLISSYTVAKHFAKIDISQSLLPIHPTAHYNMGGITVDENYKAKSGIYAIGELACASVHGANRLGCNSLLELFTSAKIATNDITSNFQSIKHDAKQNTKTTLETIRKITNKNSEIKFEQILSYRKKIQEIMDTNASIVKNHKNMKTALNEIDNIYQELRNLNNFSGIPFDVDFVNLYETQSLALMARCVLTASIFREYSIGSHYREDFPQESTTPQHTEIDNNFNVKYVDVT